MSDKAQVQHLARALGEVSPWPGTEALAERAIAAGWRLGPADFAAELRRRLDALPRSEPRGKYFIIPDGDAAPWHTLPEHLDALYAALTVAPPREEPPPCICGHPMFGQCYPDGCLTSPKATPPAPEDGTRDTGWVAIERSGRFLRVPCQAYDDLQQATIFSTEVAAYRYAVSRGLKNIEAVRRVVRSPGTRRWEECELAECSCCTWIAGRIIPLRDLPSAPGPWVLDPEGAP